MRDTIDMAREAGLIQESEYFYSPREEEADVHIKDLKVFEALVRADEREARAKRQWTALTDEEIDEIFNHWPTYNLDHYEFAKVVEAKVFEKNSATAVVIPDVLNPKDENPAFAAGWNDCRAEMLKEKK